MSRYQLRVTLLTLGVLLGFGSAIARFGFGYRFGHDCRHRHHHHQNAHEHCDQHQDHAEGAAK